MEKDKIIEELQKLVSECLDRIAATESELDRIYERLGEAESFTDEN